MTTARSSGGRSGCARSSCAAAAPCSSRKPARHARNTDLTSIAYRNFRGGFHLNQRARRFSCAIKKEARNANAKSDRALGRHAPGGQGSLQGRERSFRQLLFHIALRKRGRLESRG